MVKKQQIYRKKLYFSFILGASLLASAFLSGIVTLTWASPLMDSPAGKHVISGFFFMPSMENASLIFPRNGEALESMAPVHEDPAASPTRDTYFNDSLFIGDSRTSGLAEYAEMGTADLFAASGMSVYNIFNMEVKEKENEKVSLEQLLTENIYQRIYLMLGINELGYDMSQTVKKYEELLLKIQEFQPEASIIVEANMHVGAKKNEVDPLYNNTNLNLLNEQLKALAENGGYGFLDANEKFDDENGCLADVYTSDETHLLAKYYMEWADWIYEKETSASSSS